MIKTADARGFTLLELVIVLLVLGIFLSVISLRIENVFTGGDLQLASRLIIGRIQTLRGQAAYTRSPQMLGLHIDENTIYAIKSPESGPKGTSGPSVPAEQATPEATPLPEGVRLEDVVVLGRGKTQTGEARIRFFANGTTERSLIHLRSEAGNVITLAVNPLTGQVRLYDRYIDQQIGS
jgi:prepilin-type N-terminal cleavage/methylation domain-containing protein